MREEILKASRERIIEANKKKTIHEVCRCRNREKQRNTQIYHRKNRNKRNKQIQLFGLNSSV